MRGSRSVSGYRDSTFGSDAELQAPIRSPPLPTAVARKLSRAQAAACARYEHVHDPCALADKHDDELVMAWTRTTPVTGHHVPNRLKHNRRFDTQPFATVFVLTDHIYWGAVLPIVMDILCSSQGLLFLYTIKNDNNGERGNIPLYSA
ncbi:hypothetical protein PHYSODRAFT_342112 [Phytophthora sojae]|uniref:Uncharacterized protein n=1 Tax=Phytophthora sojae (strain P6497) TaxID=1094619 RepID=G5AFB9_PHYSP|nr:hypothetical protein PHYSODRAFT_342112 [Phytophthora sojae]EGZ05909.1 hypothetical protein PHYSODRAFT_342112 [Phytophthora sojae]|eukprot:XP_009538770.1 hypothetical protein PHYSODRAFT_342112 [Phytophthora sojae]